MRLSEDFALPAAFVRKKFLPFLAMVPLSILVMPLVGLPLTLSYIFGNLVFVGLLLGVSYLLAIKSVWVTLSQVGIQGRGPTGRKIIIPWQIPTIARRGNRSSVDGVVLAKAAEAESSLHQVFIPSPILALPSFRHALQRVAPPTHELHKDVAAPT